MAACERGLSGPDPLGQSALRANRTYRGRGIIDAIASEPDLEHICDVAWENSASEFANNKTVRRHEHVTLRTCGKSYSFPASCQMDVPMSLFLILTAVAHAIGEHHPRPVISGLFHVTQCTLKQPSKGDKDAFVHHLCLIFPFRRKGNGR